MKGYKVFNPDFTCKGFQYEVGKEYKHNGETTTRSILEISSHFENAKQHNITKPLYNALRDYDKSSEGKVFFFEDDDLVIDLGHPYTYYIEDCREECIDIYEAEIYENCCKEDFHPNPDYYRTQAENYLESEFDLIDFASKNTERWQIVKD